MCRTGFHTGFHSSDQCCIQKRDCIPMIHARLPEVGTVLLQQLNGQPVTHFVREKLEKRPTMFHSEVLNIDHFELWDPQRGWQHEAGSRIKMWWLHRGSGATLELRASHCRWLALGLWVLFGAA